MYDYCVVGGGPSGVYAACQLLRSGHSVCVIESQPSLGGCHRVRYVNGLHTEHGPRVYLGCFSSFWSFLKEEIGVTKAQFRAYSPSYAYASAFSITEKLAIARAFFVHLFSRNTMTVEEFANGFSERARFMLNRLMRTIDGGNSDKSCMSTLFDGINLGLLHGVFQPTLPMDTLVWGPLTRRILAAGGAVYLNTRVRAIARGKVICDRFSVECGKIILAVPPLALIGIENAVECTTRSPALFIRKALFECYEPYVCATVAFSSAVEDHSGVSSHPWGDVVIDMARYFKTCYGSLLVVSITNPKADSVLGVADELDRTKLLEAIVTLTRERFRAPTPVAAALSPNVTFDRGWRETDRAYLLTKNGFMKHEAAFEDVYHISHAHGHSPHTYNCIESAIHNAQHTLRMLGVKVPQTREPITVASLIVAVVAIIMFKFFCAL